MSRRLTNNRVDHVPIPWLQPVAVMLFLSMTTTLFAQPDGASDDVAAGKRVFRAGAATSNITPPLGEPIVGGWEPSPATHIHDELFARCLVLDNGSTQVAIVLCDNVGIPREVFDAARRFIEEETDLPAGNVLMAATHTHSATTARGASKVLEVGPFSEYQKFLVRRIADGVRRAINQLEPARIGWGTATAPEHVFNRRWHMRPEAEEELRNPFGGVDQVRMNPPRGHADLVRPAGPTDPEVAFLCVQSRDGRPIALVANYSLHYVGGVPRGHVSADYFGIFAERIAELLQADGVDPPFVGILSNGTSGDVNNIDFRGPSQRHDSYEKMRIVAADVAAKVYAAQETIEYCDWVPLAAAHRDLTLAVRQPSPQQIEYLAGVGERPAGTRAWHSREQIYARRIALLRDAPKEVQVPLMALRIGEVGIAAIPFETFVQTGLEIKEKSPFPRTFTIELANGSYGYLPTPEQHELGGYETWLGTNYVEQEASRKIVTTLLEMFATLRE